MADASRVHDALALLGMDRRHALAYEHLSANGPTDAAGVAASIGVSRGQAYRALALLSRRGHVALEATEPATYRAVDPVGHAEAARVAEESRASGLEAARIAFLVEVATVRPVPPRAQAPWRVRRVVGRHAFHAAARRLILKARASVLISYASCASEADERARAVLLEAARKKGTEGVELRDLTRSAPRRGSPRSSEAPVFFVIDGRECLFLSSGPDPFAAGARGSWKDVDELATLAEMLHGELWRATDPGGAPPRSAGRQAAENAAQPKLPRATGADALGVLGLDRRCALVYRHLCVHKAAKAARIAAATKLGRGDVYRALDELAHRGFVAVGAERPATYAASDPDWIFARALAESYAQRRAILDATAILAAWWAQAAASRVSTRESFLRLEGHADIDATAQRMVATATRLVLVLDRRRRTGSRSGPLHAAAHRDAAARQVEVRVVEETRTRRGAARPGRAPRGARASAASWLLVRDGTEALFLDPPTAPGSARRKLRATWTDSPAVVAMAVALHGAVWAKTAAARERKAL